jgi:hypothetical protein
VTSTVRVRIGTRLSPDDTYPLDGGFWPATRSLDHTVIVARARRLRPRFTTGLSLRGYSNLVVDAESKRLYSQTVEFDSQ